MASASRSRKENPHSARSSSDTDVMIGNALKVKRRMLGLSQQELADKLGVTFQQVQKYENGTNRITASRLNQAAEVFGISITDFFVNLPNSNDTANGSRQAEGHDSHAKSSDSESSALLSAFACLNDPRARRCLIEMAELLARSMPRRS